MFFGLFGSRKMDTSVQKESVVKKVDEVVSNRPKNPGHCIDDGVYIQNLDDNAEIEAAIGQCRDNREALLRQLAQTNKLTEEDVANIVALKEEHPRYTGPGCGRITELSGIYRGSNIHLSSWWAEQGSHCGGGSVSAEHNGVSLPEAKAKELKALFDRVRERHAYIGESEEFVNSKIREIKETADRINQSRLLQERQASTLKALGL